MKPGVDGTVMIKVSIWPSSYSYCSTHAHPFGTWCRVMILIRRGNAAPSLAHVHESEVDKI